MPRYLDVYCCLSHEFLLTYPIRKKRKYQNRNALERTKKRIEDQYANKIYPSERKWIKKIMSKHDLNRSDEYDQSLRMADGDKNMKNVIEDILNHHHRSKYRRHRMDTLESSPYPRMLSPLIKQTMKTNSSNSLSNRTDENTSIASFQSSNSVKTPSLEDVENIEEIQPLIEVTPSILLNDIFSSFFPTISPSRKFCSLSESIDELCVLIRQLLHYELTEQKATPLQATIASRLAVLLTYLRESDHQKKNSTEKMTSTEEENDVVEKPLLTTIGTQTDWEENDSIIIPVRKKSPMNSIDVHQTELTELISNSGTLSMSIYLPGRRLNRALSDTYIYRIQQSSLSHHRLNSFSETTIHSFVRRSHLLKRLGRKFQQFIELESSNTCFEASTEFTPDFLVTTMNTSKYDEDDQTEQFGIETKSRDCRTDTMSVIIDKNHEEMDTLAFNSTEKENCDSLELDIEPDNDFHLDSIADRSLSPMIYQLPILLRKTNSIDVIYEKCSAKIDFKYGKIHLIGKQVRIKSNSSLSRKLPAMNCNNNCQRSSSISNDSLTSFESEILDNIVAEQSAVVDKSLSVNEPYKIRKTRSRLSDVTDKLDANIAMAETILSMLNSFNDPHHNTSTSVKLDIFHMHIRQFLIEFDARIRLDRRKKRTMYRKHTLSS